MNKSLTIMNLAKKKKKKKKKRKRKNQGRMIACFKEVTE